MYVCMCNARVVDHIHDKIQ